MNKYYNTVIDINNQHVCAQKNSNTNYYALR